MEQNLLTQGNISSNIKSRKRKRNEAAWKCNVRKSMKFAGQEYISKKGKVIRQRKLKPPCSSSCKKKCSERFDEQFRLSIFNNFWKDGNTDNFKRQFIAGCVMRKPVERRTVLKSVSRRKFTHTYTFELPTEKVEVCKTFFLNTLDITDTTVDTALKKKTDGGIILPDKRGKKTPSNKLPEETRNSIRAHIESFPVIESHYSRERTNKKYLGTDLNLAKMYSLYLEKCKSEKFDRSVRVQNILLRFYYI